jgi:glycosyltransferase involved in cell wall biosynthesis
MGKLVSIVMPTYNQGEFLNESIVSIKNQSYTDWELIIVDDGSTDTTRNIAKAHTLDPRIKYIKKANGGTGSALNMGFSMATGDYETWWASDNNMYPDMLKMLVRHLDLYENCGHVYSNCDVGYMDTTGLIEVKRCRFSDLVQSMVWDEERFRKGYFLGICWMWRKECRTKCGLFQKEPCEDYDMALRMVDNGVNFEFISYILGWQRRHAKNLTNTVVDEKGDPNAKTRFVHEKAAKRTKRKKIAIVNLEFDCAGVGWNLKKGIERYTNFQVKHITKRLCPWANKTDLLITPYNLAEYKQILQWADVLHFNQWIWTHNPFNGHNPFEWIHTKSKPMFDYEPYFKGKKIFFHFHSGEILAYPDHCVDEVKKVKGQIFTCDPPSISAVPGSKWIPNVLDIDLPRAYDSTGMLRIFSGHGINDDRKNGAMYKRYIDMLSNNGLRVEFDCIDGIEKTESFKRRQYYQVALESLTEGYIGMVGWEAMAMGQVVIARLAQCTVDSYAALFGKAPPIINCSSISLVTKAIRELYNNPKMLKEKMEESRDWMRKHYRPEQIVNLYIKEYTKEALL